MSKSKTAQKPNVTPAVRTRAAQPRQVSAPSHLPLAESKQSTVLNLLRGADGVTIPVIMAATGWQQHSVRGFFAGVVRKKLGLNLKSEKKDGERIYRVVADKRSNRKAETVNDQAG